MQEPQDVADALLQKGCALMESRDYTGAVSLLEDVVKDYPFRGQARLQLSMAYLRAQETEKALRAFLQALQTKQSVASCKPDPQDVGYFKEILEHNSSGLPISQIAQETLKRYLPIHEKHPDYYLLNFAIALAYANLQHYAEFFQRFYHSYTHYPDHFIVDKTRGILHVKLAERAKTSEERALYKNFAIQSFASAIDKNPQDGHLYLLLIGMLRGNKEMREKTVQIIERLVKENVVIPRRDIVPYVHEAIQCKRRDLAQEILNQAKMHYPYSRAVEAAAGYLQGDETGEE